MKKRLKNKLKKYSKQFENNVDDHRFERLFGVSFKVKFVTDKHFQKVYKVESNKLVYPFWCWRKSLCFDNLYFLKDIRNNTTDIHPYGHENEYLGFEGLTLYHVGY